MHAGQVRTDEAATSSLLAPFARDVLLATGRAVHVRPADPSDIERLRAFYDAARRALHIPALLQPAAVHPRRRARAGHGARRPPPRHARRRVRRRAHRRRLVPRRCGRRGGRGRLHRRRRPPPRGHRHRAAGGSGADRPGSRVPPARRRDAPRERRHARGLPHRRAGAPAVVRGRRRARAARPDLRHRPPGRRRPARLEGRRALAALDPRTVACRRHRRQRRRHGPRVGACSPTSAPRSPAGSASSTRAPRPSAGSPPSRPWSNSTPLRISPSSPCPPPRWLPRSPGVAPPACAALSSCRRGSPRAGPTVRACRTRCSPPPAASACDSSDRTASAWSRRRAA